MFIPLFMFLIAPLTCMASDNHLHHRMCHPLKSRNFLTQECYCLVPKNWNCSLRWHTCPHTENNWRWFGIFIQRRLSNFSYPSWRDFGPRIRTSVSTRIAVVLLSVSLLLSMRLLRIILLLLLIFIGVAIKIVQWVHWWSTTIEKICIEIGIIPESTRTL